jgi:hypothetical protein
MAEKKEKILPGMKELAEKDPERFNKETREMYGRNTHRWGGSDEMPGAKESRVQTKTGVATKVEKPGGVPKVNKIPITNFGGKSGGSNTPERPDNTMDMSSLNDRPKINKIARPAPDVVEPEHHKKGGKVSASSRGDGIAQRGKTKGRMV